MLHEIQQWRIALKFVVMSSLFKTGQKILMDILHENLHASIEKF
jgi:hypothetical protein